ncbi:3'-5' exonuclease [Candidatus Microgenomates bacterium]|nr:3'-5' exonuclease [Candidatus Microgenomates bacterium]
MKIKDFRERPLLFIDLEMSGLNPLIHEILEVGVLVVDGKTLGIKAEYEAKVKPEHIETADPLALRINGYKTENWKDAKPLKKILEDLNKLAPEGMIVGFNVVFDSMFLDLGFRKFNIKPNFDYHILDVLSLAWAYVLPDSNVHEVKLSTLCKHFGIERKEKHRALADIKATYELFTKLMGIRQLGN